MEKTPENKTAAQAGRPLKHINVGLLAHVDAGKTTLAEGILYSCGAMRSLGRVDHGDTVLDNFALERSRGITIFSKQARARWREMKLTLLDTPGHVDFSAEMERTLQVMDYAVLVISGADGVQGHVETLWRLLKRYELPVFLFVNKMDHSGAHRQSRNFGKRYPYVRSLCWSSTWSGGAFPKKAFLRRSEQDRFFPATLGRPCAWRGWRRFWRDFTGIQRRLSMVRNLEPEYTRLQGILRG